MKVDLSSLDNCFQSSEILVSGNAELNRNFRIFIGDAREKIKSIPDNFSRCCITSPPYWGLRDYGIEDQIGLEETLEEYIENIKQLFLEVNRILTKDGTLWLVMGDTYTSGHRTWRDRDKKNPSRGMKYRCPTPEGLKSKDLIGLPWRIAFALQSSGWYLRSDIIWHKPNCQPESVKDRPTRAHEYVFLFSKSQRYYYDYDAIKESAKTFKGLRNRRTVWTINTEPSNYAHIAMLAPSLIEPCVLAGSETEDIIFDPFFGSGTVGEVSLKLNRKVVGIELNPDYASIAIKRLENGS